MKVCIVANLASNLYSRQNLLRSLQKAGCEITAAGCPDYAVKNLQDEFSIPFLPVFMQNRGTNLCADFRTFIGFLSLYRRLKPDVVLHFNSKPDIYGSMAAGMLGIPAINNITGLGAVFDSDGGLVQTLVCWLYRLAFSSHKSTVFFQNRDDLSLFLAKHIVRPEKTALLPGSGVDIRKFTPITLTTGTEALNLKNNCHFLFVARLVLTKGIREYISAARLLKQEFPETVFDIIGEHLDVSGFIPETELQEACASGCVVYHGNTRDVASFISKADCVVLPSYYREGVPRALLEAAAMGKPLIAADSVGTREPVREGLNGFLCKPRDTADLARTMRNFIDLPKTLKSDMGRASRKLAEEEYSDTIIASKYLEKLPKGIV